MAAVDTGDEDAVGLEGAGRAGGAPGEDAGGGGVASLGLADGLALVALELLDTAWAADEADLLAGAGGARAAGGGGGGRRGSIVAWRAVVVRR